MRMSFHWIEGSDNCISRQAASFFSSKTTDLFDDQWTGQSSCFVCLFIGCFCPDECRMRTRLRRQLRRRVSEIAVCLADLWRWMHVPYFSKTWNLRSPSYEWSTQCRDVVYTKQLWIWVFQIRNISTCLCGRLTRKGSIQWRGAVQCSKYLQGWRSWCKEFLSLRKASSSVGDTKLVEWSNPTHVVLGGITTRSKWPPHRLFLA